MHKLPIETLISLVIDHKQFYLFKEKNKNYDIMPIKQMGNYTLSNTHTIYYDSDFKQIDYNPISKYGNIFGAKHQIVTDEIILAKFILIHNKMTARSNITFLLEKITKKLDFLNQESMELLEAKLKEIVNDKNYNY